MTFNSNDRVEVWYDGKWEPGVVERVVPRYEDEECSPTPGAITILTETPAGSSVNYYPDTHFHFIRHEGEEKDAPVLPCCREGERVRHAKRGTTYTVVGVGTYQSSDPGYDGGEVVIYRGEEDGRLWVRAKCAFVDGRFVQEPKG